MKKITLIAALLFLLLPFSLKFCDIVSIPTTSLAILMDGETTKTFPLKDGGAFFVGIDCNEDVLTSWNPDTWKLEIKEKSASLKCTIKFSRVKKNTLLKDEIINQEGLNVINSKPTPNFSEIANTDEGLFPYEDDYGTSYYYRGDVKDNNVYFGGFYWKIIRINGDGSIRLIYNGKFPDAKGDSKSIGIISYNNKTLDNAYIGYMYGTAKSTDYNSTHQNTHHSTVKNFIDNWYTQNIISFQDNIADNLFCNDRSLSSLGYGNNSNSYYGFKRIIETKIPSLKCTQKNDRFTVSDTTIGNGALDYPVALITADEALLSGIVRDKKITNNYLYEQGDSAALTMTPGSYINAPAVNAEYAATLVFHETFSNTNVMSAYRIRPVINLKTDTIVLTGDGSVNNPYYVG